MRFVIPFILLAALPLRGWAYDSVTKIDMALELTWVALDLWDLKTTHDLVSRRDEGYYETNHFLGKYPDHSELNVYFAVCVLLHGTITYVLPQPYRRYWQILWIGSSFRCAYGNHRAGLRVRF